jgi:hypothetical protein
MRKSPERTINHHLAVRRVDREQDASLRDGKTYRFCSPGRHGTDIRTGIDAELLLLPIPCFVLQVKIHFGSKEQVAGGVQDFVIEGLFQSAHA